MKRAVSGELIYSASDLVRYLESPFASWMDRCHLDYPGVHIPDEESDDGKLIAQTGEKHEAVVLQDTRLRCPEMVEIPRVAPELAKTLTLSALQSNAPIIYQAALGDGNFAGFADFLELGANGKYQVWDTKLARSPKPHYIIQLCCYSELLAAALKEPLPQKFGVILGTKDRIEFRIEDFIHYYRRVKAGFLNLQDAFTLDFKGRPEPFPRADHGRWNSHAKEFFIDTDHLMRIAGISVGQIKKLKKAGIGTVTELVFSSGKSVPKLAEDSREKLVAQAKLQEATRTLREKLPDSPPVYEVLPHRGANGEDVGLAALPPEHPADVFFDMEGFPLVPGGLEYLFGLCTREKEIVNGKEKLAFRDWWAHDRNEEKRALEGFVDWVFARWTTNPGMHIYHYAAYEVSAVRRLSTRHDTRQDEVDELLRNNVFVDLYQIVRHGLRIGEENYSIKSVEHLYRPKRNTGVSTAVDSIVQYARWIESEEGRTCTESPTLKDIRDYNEDDCISTGELDQWLRKVAADQGLSAVSSVLEPEQRVSKETPPDAREREEIAMKLRDRGDATSHVLADLIDFHRREEKPMWWRLFDRAEATAEELRDDGGCIEGIQSEGVPFPVLQSMVQTYRFDPAQECKLASDASVMFAHNLNATITLFSLNTSRGELQLKISRNALAAKFGGVFPESGSLIASEYVSAKVIQTALTEVVASHLSGDLPPSAGALVNRLPPVKTLQNVDEATVDAAVRVASAMSGGCLVIQGPPGTGKTYTASRVITELLAQGKKVGVASNSHKAVMNLLAACGAAATQAGGNLVGIKVGGEAEGPLFENNSGLRHIADSKTARGAYSEGVVGGTAWLFTKPDWVEVLDFLFIDEAGQVSLANAIAMSRCAKNLVLLGDQMQLEQPIQGSHPGDAGLSALQYALKDIVASKPDAPILHAVVPSDYGLFLGESRRMHPHVCTFISESIYEGRLGSHTDCKNQKIVFSSGDRNHLPSATPIIPTAHVARETGIVFCGIEHDGNVQRSDEEVERVHEVYEELLGRIYTASDGTTRALQLEDFLFIAPYNAQVRALTEKLPIGARVGSVDKFQGQEAPVCILSLCSSHGEYGSRGLGFILDRNRINVAVSRAQCLAVIIADPRIASTSAGSIDEMKLVNLFCKLLGETLYA